jgi:predicted CXXCH cytochrome family protein
MLRACLPKPLARSAVIILATLLAAGCSPWRNGAAKHSPATYVDESGCAACHEAEVKAWSGSHHDLAMQPATERSVLGDFNDSRFTYAGVTTRFFRRDGKFYVNTDGPDGRLANFPILHAFGVAPLQQYLIPLPGGRLQALSIAWDTKARRWFHLYPAERVDFRDELHWTKPSQNWNHMCGECHATGYRKIYNAATASYKTTAARFDVGCQACHGPASRHAAWARRAGKRAAKRPAAVVKRDFDVDLAARDSRPQIDTCARCHSRRGTLSADYRHGAPLMDTHLPALLTEGLYHADGQILEEDYEYGSFLQSRMFARGVRCSDCHDPHSMKLHKDGDAVCVTCHNATAPAARAGIDTSGLQKKDYTSAAHHFHKPGAPGSHCVECHAPTRTYMVVHPRIDHSFRIPRPDLSVAIGTPNACSGCHSDRSARWAADVVATRYGPGRRRESHYGVALDAGRFGKAGAVPGLVALADDRNQPAIVRATALDLLSRYPGRSALAALQGGLADRDPLVRRAAVSGQERLSPEERAVSLAPILDDSVRAVRIEAARLLAPARASLAPALSKRLDAVLVEFVAAELENADRPEALTNLGNFHASVGDTARAAADYRKAIALDPGFVPAYVNLADLFRAGGRDDDDERAIRDGLRSAPGAPALHEALGLALVRRGLKTEALAEFAAATKAAPDEPRHAYVYAVSLHDAGRGPEAMRVLESIARRRGDRDVLLTLATYAGESGGPAAAEPYLRTLAAINPDDPALPAPTPGR